MERYGADRVLNPRSPAFKARNLDPDTLTAADAVSLIEEDVNLMKRPLLVSGREAVFGWDQDALEAMFSSRG